MSVQSVQFRFYFSPRPYLADLWSVKKLFDFAHRRMVLNCMQTWMSCRYHCRWQKRLSQAMSLKERFFVFLFVEKWKSKCADMQYSIKKILKSMPQIKNKILKMLLNWKIVQTALLCCLLLQNFVEILFPTREVTV